MSAMLRSKYIFISNRKEISVHIRTRYYQFTPPLLVRTFYEGFDRVYDVFFYCRNLKYTKLSGHAFMTSMHKK